MTFEYIIV